MLLSSELGVLVFQLQTKYRLFNCWLQFIANRDLYKKSTFSLVATFLVIFCYWSTLQRNVQVQVRSKKQNKLKKWIYSLYRSLRLYTTYLTKLEDWYFSVICWTGSVQHKQPMKLASKRKKSNCILPKYFHFVIFTITPPHFRGKWCAF